MVYRHPTHGILTPYQWYMEPHTHGILTPYPWYIDPPDSWYFDPLPMVFDPPAYLLIRNEGGQKYHGGSIYHTGGSKFHMTSIVTTLPFSLPCK
jgi:hypothetical protein